jgi:hypothetical protein
VAARVEREQAVAEASGRDGRDLPASTGAVDRLACEPNELVRVGRPVGELDLVAVWKP